MTWSIAVVGATGTVGREMLNVLAERQFPADSVAALASRRSQGKEVSFADSIIKAQALENFDFAGTDVVLMAAGSAVSRAWADKITATGAVIIDNASCFRMEPDVPLIVPEVNPSDIAGYRARNIIANPNCSTIQMLVALAPLHQQARIRRVVVSTYQSVSGAGRDAMDELFSQTRALFGPDPVERSVFPKQIAFNVIPQIGDLVKGESEEEQKMIRETGKILDPDIKVTATCVRVPVMVGHAESINIELESPLSPAEARDILREAPGCLVVDKSEDGGYITPLDCVGDYAAFVSRIRRDPTVENGLNLWVVSDNLRKGAALNAVQIAEVLCEEYLKKAA